MSSNAEGAMCGMCDPATRGAELAKMMELVERYGWAIQFVEGEKARAQWAYTVGLVRHGLPELVVTGLRPERAGALLNETAHGAVCHDERWEPGQRFRMPERMRIEVVGLPHPEAHLGTVVALFPDRPLRALQLVWCDGRGLWPWNPRFNGRAGGQPVLGPRSRRST